jgi:hypothetical protein
MFKSSRSISCAAAAAILFAALIGINATSSGAVLTSGQPPTIPTVQYEFSPMLALIGLMLGSLLGAAVGALWHRSRVAGAILVSLLCAFIGLMAAALLGAETQVTVSDTSVSMTHGPADNVLIGGAGLGMLLGIICVWQFSPTKRITPIST